MSNSIRKIIKLSLFAFFMSISAFSQVRPVQTNLALLNPVYFFNLLSSNIYFNNFFATNNIFYFVLFQQPIDYNIINDTSKVYKPIFLRAPEPYRYKAEHLKFNRRFKQNPDSYRVYFDIDSAGKTMSIKETFYDKVTGYPYKISLDDYLANRDKQLRYDLWDTLTSKYDLTAALSGGDISRMIGQATGLTIPIPPNPLTNLFGKPEINLNVNGEVNLRVGWRFDSQNLGTVSAFGQTQSSPVFSQDIRVNVSGGIGDKFKIGTDWNTRRQFEYDNSFKVAYEGEDDEIIRLIQVGNVSLPSQSSLIGGGQSLFGIRADFQFGPLFIKTIASQRRGERKFIDARGGASKQQFQIRAYDWAKNHFFLDTAYKRIYREYFKYSTPIIPTDATFQRVKEIEVWESTTEITNGPYGAYAACFTNLEPKRLKQNDLYDPALKFAPIKTGEVEKGVFMRLDSNRYRIDYNLGTLTIINLRQDRYYAVAYRTEGQTLASEDDLYYGQFSTLVGQKDTLLLKLIYRPNLLPNYTTLWDRQMKNIYSINASQVNTQDTKIGLWYINQNNDSTDILPGAPDKLVTIMKVDQVNNATGTPPADGQFDLRPPFFNAQFGEITFPSLEPFREGLVDYFTKQGTPQLANQFVYPQIYDTTYDASRRATDKDRFVISGEVTGKQTDRISLGAYNLARNSVRVTLDGVPLREDEDFVVDYFSGTLILRNQRAQLPNANLRIEYEQQDIFNISTRTLLGLRADYQLFKSRRLNANLGFTAMLYDQSAVIDRVRIGDEPVSNKMVGFDAKLNWDAPWLTKLLDMLPFYDTKAPSSLNLSGEWAMMLPTPNKRKSEICFDNNSPVVYVDDFEGAQRYISLGLSPFQWTFASQPVDSLIAPNDTLSSLYRGKTYWWQYFLPRVSINDPYPKRQAIQGRSNLSPLYINFDPYERGIYNKNPEFRDSANPEFKPDSAQLFFDKNKPKIWGGFQRLLSSFYTNFDNENIEYIEIMMHIESFEEGKSRMFVDLGMISEDVIPDRRLSTEDGITAASPIPNGIIDKGEDIGIDALDDNAERDLKNMPWPLNLEKDPSRDNYKFDFGKDDFSRNSDDFKYYNNYEGNATSELGQFPDQEVLNKNNGQTISLDNSYFSYEVSLNPNSITNPQIVGGNPDKGWFLYRIPIRNPDRKVGNPSFSNIQYVRVWFKGGVTKLWIADWRLAGSQWQRISNMQSGVSPADSTLQVAFVNVEENSDAPDYYSMPPCVSAPRQLNNPDPNMDVKLNEQSLSLSVKNLRYGDERMAVRYFRSYDIFYYKQLKFFIHGDGSMPINNVMGAMPKAYSYIRFGIDSMNYYEYRRPLVRGWQNVEITLADLAAIKQVRDSTHDIYPVPGDPLAFFRIKGNPILTRVQFFAFGIANPAERYPNELTTTMWIDELRLIDPESRSDWGGVASAELKLADLGTINTNINHTNPNFHKLEERFGTRVAQTNFNVTVQGNLEKFAPKSFKEMKLPITYTHSEFTTDPEFEANNDINLLKAAEAAKAKALTEGRTQQEAQRAYDSLRTRSQNLKVMDSWALTGIKLGLPINSWLIRETINKLTVGYSYSQEFERSYIYSERFNWQWNLNAQYANNIPPLLSVAPLKWSTSVPVVSTYSDLKLNFLPASISFGLNMVRSRTTEQSRYLNFPSPVFRNFTAMRQGQFSWKFSENGLINPILDYSFSTTSSLVPLEVDETGRQRTASQLASEMFFKDGRLIDFGQNNMHVQTFTLNFKPRFPFGAAITKYFDNSGTFATTYNWLNPLQPLEEIKDVAKSASWNNSIRYSLNIKLKSVGDDLFGVTNPKQFVQKMPKDTNVITQGGILGTVASIFKTVLFDWDNVKFDINQSSSSVNPGVFGNTGFDNFWARGVLGMSDQYSFGPSFPYQLGLVTDPHGGFRIRPSSAFPFFGFETFTGKRPPNAVLQDNYMQRTSLDIRTSRPLWEGAILDLNWRSEVGYNKNQTVITDSLGRPTFTNVIALESYNKTILTLPSIFGFNLFNNTIQHVIALYESKKPAILNSSKDTVTKNQALLNALAESFHDGLEAFGFFGGAIGKFLPSINWAIRWEGLEKWNVLEAIGAKKISLEHKYQSRYTENAQITDNGKTIQGQMVQHGFQPLIGATVTFDEKKLKGLLTGTIRYSTTNSYQITSANRATITKQSTDELQIQASYTIRGFTFPLFNLNVQNDLEFSFLASLKKNDRATFDIMNYTGEKGSQLDGNTQIKIEPRVRYMMSNRVKASFFVSYEGTFTSGAATPGFSTTQLGLDINININGGR